MNETPNTITDLTPVPASAAQIVPAGAPMDLDWEHAARRAIAAKAARDQMIGSVLTPGLDYGTIPGAGDKPTLLKPGAEKVIDSLNLWADYVLEEVVERTDDNDPLYLYRFRCVLRQRGSNNIVASGMGTCSSLESRYRWRKAERKCPNCGKENIRKSKQGQGWYCWAKTGGCGSQFPDGEASIESQETGRIPNPDIHDTQNTVCKMGQKRALVAAVLNLGLSDKFTQDLEDKPEAVAVETPENAPQTSGKAVPSDLPLRPVNPVAVERYASEMQKEQWPKPGPSEPPRPGLAPPIIPGLDPEKPMKFDEYKALIEGGKARFLKSISPGIVDAVNKYLTDKRLILETEIFGDVDAQSLFRGCSLGMTKTQVQAAMLNDYEAHMREIKAILDGNDDQIPGAEAPSGVIDSPRGVTEPRPMPPDAQRRVVMVQGFSKPKSGMGKKGPWTKYGMVDSAKEWWNTFDKKLIDKAMGLQGQRATVWYTSDAYGNTMVGIEAANE